MHGLINRSLQCFLRDSFGAELWRDIAAAAEVPAEGFEPMLHYDDAVTLRLIEAAAARLERSGDSLLEDLGTYLVSHPNREALRRLLRFGGVGFADFLDSIDDLPGRARLAVPDLALPQIELADDGPGRYRLGCRSPQEGFAAVLVGVLRAMADDYGALVMIEHLGRDGAEDSIAIELLEQDFAEGRRFDLSGPGIAGGPDASGPGPDPAEASRPASAASAGLAPGTIASGLSAAGSSSRPPTGAAAPGSDASSEATPNAVVMADPAADRAPAATVAATGPMVDPTGADLPGRAPPTAPPTPVPPGRGTTAAPTLYGGSDPQLRLGPVTADPPTGSSPQSSPASAPCPQ